MYTSNPCCAAIFEASWLWPGRTIGVVHSIGCGTKVSPVSGGGHEGMMDWIEKLQQICLDTDSMAEDASRLLGLVHPSASYVRMQMPPTTVKSLTNEVERFAELKLVTEEWLQTEAVKKGVLQMRRDLGLLA
mmetsp:Transcript_55595/g.125047  ORF Transcript_55595/g.125047 Transcript_55595/m.125047 type:complete len:132 (+) Transcript_55595:1643-2038(+)